MISIEEARKVSKELMDILPSKISEEGPDSVGMVLASLLYDVCESTRKNLSIQETFTLLEKHHKVVDTVMNYFVLREMQGGFNEPS